MSDGEPTIPASIPPATSPAAPPTALPITPPVAPPTAPPTAPPRLDLPAGIARLAWLSTVTSALLLTATLAGNALLLLLGARPTLWLLALVDIGPLIAVFLSNIATFAGYYGSWRIVARRDEYDVAGDAKNQLAQVPGMLQDLPAQLRRRLGCLQSAALLTFALAVATTVATLAPPPFRVLGAALGPSPMATATATATAPVSPSVASLVVTPTSATQQCDATSGLQPLNITLDNSASAVATNWSISITDVAPGVGIPWASADPNQGAVPAGASTTTTLTPTSRICYTITSAQVFTATLITPTGATTITDTISPPSASLMIPAGQDMKQTCSPQGAPAYTVTLDNAAGTIDVNWSFNSFDFAPDGAPWATASPLSGTVPAGGIESVTITPQPAACRITSATVWHAQISYGGSGTLLALTDTLSPYVIG